MARKEIDRYYARWDCVNHRGRIGVRDIDSDWHQYIFADPMEFRVVVDLLRYEKPVYWDEREYIRTGDEEPGEEET